MLFRKKIVFPKISLAKTELSQKLEDTFKSCKIGSALDGLQDDAVWDNGTKESKLQKMAASLKLEAKVRIERLSTYLQVKWLFSEAPNQFQFTKNNPCLFMYTAAQNYPNIA